MEYLNPTIIVSLCIAIFIFIAGIRIGLRHGRKQGKLEKVAQSEKISRRVLGGQTSEHIAPLLPTFPFDPGDCRFMGKPIDYIVFKGMNGQDISEVIFLEVKSGVSRSLNPQEKRLKEAIMAKRVRWEQFNVDIKF